MVRSLIGKIAIVYLTLMYGLPILIQCLTNILN